MTPVSNVEKYCPCTNRVLTSVKYHCTLIPSPVLLRRWYFSFSLLFAKRSSNARVPKRGGDRVIHLCIVIPRAKKRY